MITAARYRTVSTHDHSVPVPACTASSPCQHTPRAQVARPTARHYSASVLFATPTGRCTVPVESNFDGCNAGPRRMPGMLASPLPSSREHAGTTSTTRPQIYPRPCCHIRRWPPCPSLTTALGFAAGQNQESESRGDTCRAAKRLAFASHHERLRPRACRAVMLSQSLRRAATFGHA
jgi:hypothetical protein